jgi:hypothetical protein
VRGAATALVGRWQNQVFGSATLTDIALRLRVPHEVLGPTFDALVRRGLALHSGGQERSDPGNVTDGRLWLTQSGIKEVEAALERIAHRMLGQRGWDDDRALVAAVG